MYLKRLEMQGFKSFADRTELTFVPGITAVVGPNGSGKSNVTDAIRWVLGEQSAKSLRGTKMEDVIFAGSDTRKPVGFCEVSITFDNSERRLPVDYTEVTITRRVYRSGESEYFLNRQPCRLKDINELFMDTGIGKEAYSMIGQGKIEEILSSKSEDRRAIFEEAAGIVKYKTRKKEAEKKLESTEQNLARIHDLIHELDGQVGPLREQAEKAERYKQLKEELKQVEIQVYVHKIEQVHDAWKIAGEQVTELKTETLALATEVNTKEAQLQERKHQLAQLEEHWERIQAELLQISEELEKAEGQREVWLERMRNREQTERSLTERIQVLTEEKARLKQEAEEYAERLKQKREEVAEAEEELAQIQERLGSSDHQNEDLLSQWKEEMQAIQGRRISLQSEQQYIEQQRGDIQERIKQITSQYEQLDQELARWQEDQHKVQDQIHTTAQALIDKKSRMDQLTQERNELEQESKRLLAENRKYEQQYNRLRSQLEVLKEMEAEHAGFAQGVKEVLKARDRGETGLSGVLGAVAELIQVPQEYEAALETALGGALQHVVVEDERTGRQAIQYLKEKRLGRATFLPLDVIQPRTIHESDLQKVRNTAGFVGVARDLVRCEERFARLLEHLLGNVLVAQTLEVANQLARILGYRYRIVTLDGDVVNPGGSMSGGSRQANKQNLLGRSRQIEQLEKELADLQTAWNHLQEQVKACEEKKRLWTEEWEQLRSEGESLRIQEQQLKSQLRELTNQQDSLARQRQQMEIQLKQLNQKEAEYSERMEQIGHEREQLRMQAEELEAKIQQLESQMKLEQAERVQVQEQWTEWKVKVARLKQEELNLAENLTRAQGEWERIQNQLIALEEEKQSLAELGEKSEAELKHLGERIEELRKNKEEVQSLFTQVRQHRERLQRERDALEHEVRYTQQSLRKYEEQLHNLEVRVNRYDVELNHLLQKLSEEYQMTFERAKSQYGVPDEPAQAERQVRSLKQKISQLGEVNLGAIEEYKRLTERLQFLKTQEEDLLKAKQSLYEIIQQLEEEMGKRFLEAFERIREEYQDVFVKMFGGGRADLRLSDPNNLLETGIEIVAQPPGKKLQQLSLLSGGERSLAAIALLFAVLRIKPVPFCFLDEVDAALDEANLTRFTRYMREFASKTQFIVITHRKHTMEGADVLYGITMQESGVSKLVSVKLEEYDEQREVAAARE